MGTSRHSSVFLLQASIVAAFLFLSLVLTAYVKIVGWVAVGFSAAAGILAPGLLKKVNWNAHF